MKITRVVTHLVQERALDVSSERTVKLAGAFHACAAPHASSDAYTTMGPAAEALADRRARDMGRA